MKVSERLFMPRRRTIDILTSDSFETFVQLCTYIYEKNDVSPHRPKIISTFFDVLPNGKCSLIQSNILSHVAHVLTSYEQQEYQVKIGMKTNPKNVTAAKRLQLSNMAKCKSKGDFNKKGAVSLFALKIREQIWRIKSHS